MCFLHVMVSVLSCRYQNLINKDFESNIAITQINLHKFDYNFSNAIPKPRKELILEVISHDMTIELNP
jgi:hypothetical protein